MDHFDKLEQYRIIVCKTCKYAVLPSQLSTHLASAKHRVPSTQRSEIEREVAAWPGLLQSEADLNQLHVPINTPSPFQYLTTYTDGRRCDFAGNTGQPCRY